MRISNFIKNIRIIHINRAILIYAVSCLATFRISWAQTGYNDQSRIYQNGAEVIIDGSLHVTGASRSDKYFDHVGISTPTTPSTNHARVWLNNNAKQICAIYDNGVTNCFSASSGTVTSVSAGLGLSETSNSGAVTLNLSTPIANSFIDGSSITKQGQNVIFLGSTLQSGATFYVSSGTANTLYASTGAVTYQLWVDSAGIHNFNIIPFLVGDANHPALGEGISLARRIPDDDSDYDGIGTHDLYLNHSHSQSCFSARSATGGTQDEISLIGFQASPVHASSGLMSNKMADFYGVLTTTGGTMTSSYGLYLEDPTGTGTIQNNYGIYIATHTYGTNYFGLYSAGTTTPNVIQGRLIEQSSITVQGADGINVLYGATLGSATVSNLTSGQCVQTGTGGLLTVTGSACASTNGFASLTATQTFSGANTFSSPSSITVSSISFISTSLGGVKGSTLTDNAATGFVGEYKSSAFQNVSSTSSTNIGDYTNIVLSAGDWDVTACVDFEINGATVTGEIFFISTTAGASFAGTAQGDNYFDLGPALSGGGSSMCIANWRLSTTGATVYFKMDNTFTVATPKIYGRISARRIR